MSEENVKLSIKEQIFCNEYVKNNKPDKMHVYKSELIVPIL